MMILLYIILSLIMIITAWCAICDIKKGRRKTHWLTFLVTVITAMIGFLITISDGYLSQYDYDTNRICHYRKIMRHGVRYEELKKETKTPPKFIFVLDGTESTKINVFIKDKKHKDELQKRINSVNKSRHNKKREKKTFNWDYEKGTIPYNELLRLRLLSMLEDLEKMFPDSLDYTIVTFGEKTVFSPAIEHPSKVDNNIDKHFDEFLDFTFTDKRTDFCELFESLHNEFVINSNKLDQFKSREYILILLSDLYHDVTYDGKWDKISDEQKIVDLLQQINDASINMKYLIHKETCALPLKPHIISVKELLQENLSPNTCQEIDILEESVSTWYPITVKQPFPLFYSNSVYEDSLKTFILFEGFDKKKPDSVAIQLAKYTDNDKMEYGLSSSVFNYCRLSNRNKKIIVSKGDTIWLAIKGFIPAPYKSFDIVIDDYKTGVQYVIPVIFFKKFPRICWLLIVGIAGFTIIAVVLFLIWKPWESSRKNQKNNSNNNDNDSWGYLSQYT